MKQVISTLILLVAVVSSVLCYEETDIKSARIETCRGCSLNRLPEVKKFVMQDAPEYDRLEVKFISGAVPELILLGEGDHELDRLPLSQLDREQCNKLIQKNGFVKKDSKLDL